MKIEVQLFWKVIYEGGECKSYANVQQNQEKPLQKLQLKLDECIRISFGSNVLELSLGFPL